MNPRPNALLSRRELLCCGLAAALDAPSSRPVRGADPSKPIDIGSRRELMVDEALIDRFLGKAELRLHHPVPREEVLRWDKPWEGNTTSYTEVFRVKDRYQLFYRGWHYKLDPKLAQGHAPFPCLAESDDGIHWRRPELELVTFQKSNKNNILEVPTRVGKYRTIHSTFTVSINENPDAPPHARYIGFVLATDPRGLLPLQSADGLRWQPVTEELVIAGDAFDSPNRVFWDTARGEYRAYWRYFSGGELGKGLRGIKTATSRDLVKWSKGIPLAYPGVPEEQLYTNQIFPYYRAPHLLVGFPNRYLDRGWSEAMRALPDKEHREMRAKAVERVGTALTDTLFMSSRDGSTFQRWGEAFLRPGIERPGTWNYSHTHASCPVVETRSALPGAPNELSLYVTEDYWTGKEGSALRRYTLRIDGFVSVNARFAGGEFVTKPLVFAGDRLVLNFSTSVAGALRVELQDGAGKPIPGYGLEDCPVLFGDSLERAVAWKQGVRTLAGTPVRMRFVMKDADLFSFRFTT